MKRLLTTVWILLMGCFLCLIVNFSVNETLIKEYNTGNFIENKLAFLGFFEPNIADYNNGNVYYQKGNYDAAITAYQDALKHHSGHPKECMIRINLVLAMVTPIDPAEIIDSQIEDTMELLEDAKQILCVHGCAAEDGSGHNKEAQKLKEDIDRFEEELKEMQETQQEDDTQENESEQTTKQDDENKEDIRQQLKEIQRQSSEERNKELSENENLENFDYYDGQTW